MLLIVVRHISQTVSLRGPLASFVVQFIVFVVMTMMSVCQGKLQKIQLQLWVYVYSVYNHVNSTKGKRILACWVKECEKDWDRSCPGCKGKLSSDKGEQVAAEPIRSFGHWYLELQAHERGKLRICTHNDTGKSRKLNSSSNGY